MGSVVAGGGELFQINSKQIAFNSAFFASPGPESGANRGKKNGFGNCFELLFEFPFSRINSRG